MTQRVLRVALLADGPSDSSLLAVISWTLNQRSPGIELADPGFRARVMSKAIEAEMRETIEIFRPDILFVHRDAEARILRRDVRRFQMPAALS